MDASTDAAIKDAGAKDSSVTDAAVKDGSTGDGAVVVVMGEPPSLTGITAAHNVTRANATPTPSPALPALTWSDTVATAAQAWANNCMWKHSGNGYGENIYASYGGGPPSGAAVVSSWSSESANYDYAANTCAPNKVCGHYTQVVARRSTMVGCGAATCTENSPWGSGTWYFVVCDYSLAGNFGGQRPY